MRFIISTITGLAMIGGLFFVGGASLTPEDATPSQEVIVQPLPLAAPFLEVVIPDAVEDALVPPPTTTIPRRPTRVVPDPAVGQDLNRWFGCAPPNEGSVCILRPTGVEALLPDAPAQLEDWRPLVNLFFEPEDVDRAMDVIWCESHGDRSAKNPTSTASGLFQHLRSLWPPRAEAAGYGGADVFDPIANVATAAWLVYEGGGWSHWYPSRPCWG